MSEGEKNMTGKKGLGASIVQIRIDHRSRARVPALALTVTTARFGIITQLVF